MNKILNLMNSCSERKDRFFIKSTDRQDLGSPEIIAGTRINLVIPSKLEESFKEKEIKDNEKELFEKVYPTLIEGNYHRITRQQLQDIGEKEVVNSISIFRIFFEKKYRFYLQ